MKSTFKILLNPDGNAGGGNAPAPETLTLAEANSRVEKARKEEKDKLYPTITSLEAAVTESKAALEATKTALNELTTKYEALVKAQSANGTVDIRALIDETTTRVAQSTRDSLASEISSLNTKLNETQTRSRKLELKQYRDNAIEAAGGPDALIVALVTGDSEEAIDASVATAKTEFERISQKIKANGNSPDTTLNPRNDNATVTPPFVPGRSALPPARAADGTQLPDVKSMTIDQYKANRDALKKQTFGRYAQSA